MVDGLLLAMNFMFGAIAARYVEPVDPVTPGNVTYTSGTNNFTVPAYNTLVIEMWGAGGSAGAARTDGPEGLASTIAALSLTAGGGGGGKRGENGGSGGARGSASGGDVNTQGGAGGTGTSQISGSGGNSPNGGATIPGDKVTSVKSGNVPGGGAGSAYNASSRSGGGGGGGAYLKKTFTPDAGGPQAGVSLSAIVGATGSNGARGEIRISWS
ncbi:hypothetical protein [Terrihabitans sp. B22-R8]|uniref:hypothetical protein n=1 Tax=Terrihabitans sp. B22-R8 TaxID=3425128 RepID=UPI00403CE630